MKIFFVIFFFFSALNLSAIKPTSCSEKWQKNLKLKAGGAITGMSFLSLIPFYGLALGPMGVYNESWHYRMKSKVASLLESISNIYLLRKTPQYINQDDIKRLENFYVKYGGKYKFNNISYDELSYVLYKYNKVAYEKNKCHLFGEKYGSGYYRDGYKYTKETLAKHVFKNGDFNEQILYDTYK